MQPIRIDVVNECVWRGSEKIELKPKAFSLLKCLVDHAGQLVTKDQLLDRVWPETFVGDAVLKVAIADLRRSLGDPTAQPVYIETLHRRGYRFIGALESARHNTPAMQDIAPPPPAAPFRSLPGREDTLARLDQLFQLAASGRRQIVFVTGEAGIGKTTVIEAFLAAHSNVRAARGNCFEHHSAGEAYFPIFEALAALSSGPSREIVQSVLQKSAPTWLVQMPALISSESTATLQRQVLGATPERMLREMAEVLETLSAAAPMLLVIDDLHWSDSQTLDLLNCLARRTDPARLMILASYRPAEISATGHPLRVLKQDLQLRRACEELPLRFLTQAQAEICLSERYGDVAPEVSQLLYQRSEGNPLFLVNIADYAAARGALAGPLAEVATVVPDTLRQIVEQQTERLDAAVQRVLEIAAIAGLRFTAAAVSYAGEEAAGNIEEICDRLVRSGSFLRAEGARDLPGARFTAAYAFIHSVYRDALYRRTAEPRRMRIHIRVGEFLEQAAPDAYSDLALHFERGRDYHRAIRYLWAQARQDVRRYANDSALAILRRALDLVDLLPKHERAGLRASLTEQIGIVCRSKGSMSEACEHFASLAAGARRAGDIDAEVKALLDEASVLSWLDRDRCLLVVDQAFRLSAQVTDPLLKAHAFGYCGYWNFLLREYREQDAETCRSAISAARDAGDPVMLSLHVSRWAFFLAARSDYAEAIDAAEEGMNLAVAAGDAFDYMLCHFCAAWALLHTGEWSRMRRVIESGAALAESNGHQLWALLFQLEGAWLLQRAFSYRESLELCDRALEHAGANQPSKLVVLVLKAFSHLGLEQLDEAGACFEEIAGWTSRGRVLMDWMWMRQARYGVALYWMMRGDHTRAAEAAQAVCDAAGRPFERTLMALGRRLLAQLAWRAGDRDGACAHIREALRVVTEGDAPLAAWQVMDCAADILGDPSMRERSAEALAELGSRMDSTQLRTALFSSPRAQVVLAAAPRVSAAEI